MDPSFLLNQFAYQAPLLLVSLVGLIIAAVNRNRCPTPALLTMLGCGLIFLVGLAQPVISSIFWQQLREGELTPEQYTRMMGIIGIVVSCTRAVGVALVIVAVFMGRSRPQQFAEE